jgi:hypothetical protein
MDMGRTEKKLREARFFLEKMRGQERGASVDREPFDFCLSAFLAAAHSVDRHLRQEYWAVYPRWREAWDSRLQDSERRLMELLVEDRDEDVHESTLAGSPRSATEACAQCLELLERMVEAFRSVHCAPDRRE